MRIEMREVEHRRAIDGYPNLAKLGRNRSAVATYRLDRADRRALVQPVERWPGG
jgi:hypothetical protein